MIHREEKSILPTRQTDFIDPGSSSAETLLLSRLRLLKEEARRREPGNWWLTQTLLTDLGYVKLALHMARVLVKSRGQASGIRVLDWGGGPGFFSYLLQSLGLEPTYYDFRSDCPSYAYVLGLLPGPVYYAEDSTILPFPDREFDAVVSLGVLEHVADPSVSLRETRRVLAANGNLFVYHFPNRFGYN